MIRPGPRRLASALGWLSLAWIVASAGTGVSVERATPPTGVSVERATPPTSLAQPGSQTHAP